jgi:uncharacterized membrane protein YgcG
VPAGELISASDQAELQRAVANAEALSGLEFVLVIGRSDGEPRDYAVRLHGQVPDPRGSVLVLCDPDGRALEIVTGRRAMRVLDNLECRLAAASMQTSFAAGDIVGGLVNGLQQLGEAARAPRTLHAH